MTTERVLRTITDLQPGDHLCSLYQTEAEHRALLTPFLRQGLERGEKVFYIVDVHRAETILDYLRDDGLEVEPYLAGGQLRIMTPDKTYMRGGIFNPDDMIALLRTETARALAEGYQALRVAGEMTWALQGLPGSDRLLEYESKLSTFFPDSMCLAICLYEWRRLGPEMLFNMLATHPTVAVGTEIYDNFYYLPPTDLVQDGQPMAVLHYWLGSLAERKRAEEALQASEARYRAIVEDQTEFICRFLPDGRLTFVNEAYCRYFGWKCEDLIGRSLMQFIPAENRAELKEHLASLHRENPVTTREEWNVLPGGEVGWLQWTNRAIFDEQGRLVEFQSVGRDITERKQTEEALRQSEFDLAEAQRVARLGSWSFDIATNTVRWSEELYRIFDVEKTAFGGMYETFLSRVHPDDRTRVLQMNAEARSSGEPFEVEYRITTRSGQLKHIREVGYARKDSAGAVSGLFGTAQDITERKRAEAVRAQLAAIVESSDDAIMGRTLDGVIASWNRGAERLYDYTAAEAIGRPITIIVPPDRLEEHQDIMARLRQGEHIQHFETVRVRKDGQPIDVSVTISPVKDPVKDDSGKLIGSSAIARDITERKWAEEELHRHAARMEALAEISQALAEVGLDVQAVLDTIARQTAEVIGDVCVIRLLSSDERWFKSVAFHHANPEVKALMESLHPTTPVSASHELLAHILRTGQSLLIPIVTQEQLRQSTQPEYRPFFEQVGLHSVLIVPLRVEGRVIGTLGLSRDQPGHPYTPDDQVLLQDLADRAALTLQNAQLFEQVHGAHERQQALSRLLLDVQEAERRHIARELHDEIGQVLTGLKLLLDMSARLPAQMVKSRLAEAQALVNELLERVDELSLDLRPTMLDDLGLLPTLLWHFERYTQQTHIQVTFKQTGLEGGRFTPEIEMTVYRLIQEALTNVARHAGVGEVTVRLWVGQDTLGVEIEDRGTGFDPLANGASSGLSGMRERVVLLGGQLTIESSPGSGTDITAELPLPIPAERSDADDDDRSGG